VLSDTAGLTTVEYSVLFVVLVVAALVAWRQLGQSLIASVRGGEAKYSEELEASTRPSSDHAPDAFATGARSPAAPGPGSAVGATHSPSSSSTTTSAPSWLGRAKAATIEHPAVLQFEKDHPVAAVIAKEVAITAAEALVPGLATVNAVRTFAAPNASSTDKTLAGISVVGSALPVIGAVFKGTVKLAKAVATARKVSRTTKVVEEATETPVQAAQALTRSASRAGGTLRPMARSLGSAGDDLLLKKAVNSNLPHAVSRGVERGIFGSADEAATALRALTEQITKSGTFPSGTLVDTARAGRFLVPIGNGGRAVYQLAANGTARLKTVLIGR
jgi:hypothetical protein